MVTIKNLVEFARKIPVPAQVARSFHGLDQFGIGPTHYQRARIVKHVEDLAKMGHTEMRIANKKAGGFSANGTYPVIIHKHPKTGNYHESSFLGEGEPKIWPPLKTPKGFNVPESLQVPKFLLTDLYSRSV